MKLWREKGPLGKLHNNVVYIQRSTQRIQEFLSLSGNKHLSRDNSTRWNSWYKMISSAIPLSDAIDIFFHRRPESTLDKLQPEDWTHLQKMQDFLVFFNDATISSEGRTDTLECVLPTMDFLLECFEEWKKTHALDPFIGPCCNAGWKKLEKYYALTDRSPAYIAAMVLCPAQKWQYIEEQWDENWLEDCQKKMRAFWEKEYKSTGSLDLHLAAPKAPSTGNRFQQWEQVKQCRRPQLPSLDEYDRYCQSSILPEVKDARAWWLEPTQQKTYPNLYRMALDILSIPAMSAEPERLFSSCKISITDRRNQLGIESIEAIECLKSWFRSGVSWVD